MSMNLLDFVRISRRTQGTSAFHVTHVYQNCQRANEQDELSRIHSLNTFKNSSGF